MLIVSVRVSGADAWKSVARIVRGDVVSFGRDGKDLVGQLVVHDESELERLRATGASVEILFDSRSQPDPREEVSQIDRYAEELARLQRQHERGPDREKT